MKIANGNVLSGNWVFSNRDIEIKNERIVDRTDTQSDSIVIDATDCLVMPGLVDIHIHACNGFDFCDASENSLDGMSEYLIENGVTSFLGASMALPVDRLKSIFTVTGNYIKNQDAQSGNALITQNSQKQSFANGKSQLLGIYMEGPFFNKNKKGAQAEKDIIDPDILVFDDLNRLSNNSVRLVALAPEQTNAQLMIKSLTEQGIKVSIAHTEASYDIATDAFNNGANHVTHLFNAMPPFNHRDPGVIGAASDFNDAFVEIISDGTHLHSSVVRAAFQWFGSDKIVLISDAMKACGLDDGTYELGGQTVYVKNRKAVLQDGTLAGSASNLLQCVKTAIEQGIKIEDAIKAASYNAAKSIGFESDIGSLDTGKKADVIITDKSLNILYVIKSGIVAYTSDNILNSK